MAFTTVADSPASNIDVGRVVGNYTITTKIGEGGMGVVYLAEHPVIGKKVAMKAIHPELSRNPEVVSRFVMEAKAVNQIGHEHIVDIGDFGNTPSGEFYFIMEYLQGESLADRLKRDALIPQERALHIASQVADALGASHSHGIIHRDLKPENIFLVDRPRDPDFVKVLDFGLAKLTQVEEKVTHKTRAGSVMGTPYYMSPEQGEGRLQIDHRADIYSLGIILFEMLTGKVPFGGEGYGEIIVKHVTHQAPSVRKINPQVSAAVEVILFRALAKDRNDRFQSMEDFREALLDPEAYLETVPEFGLPAELTGVTRLAAPMSRSEMNFAGVVLDSSDGMSGIPTPPGPYPLTPVGSGAIPVLTPGPASTFRNATGQLAENVVLTRRSGRKVVFGMLVGVALAGAVIVGFGRKGRTPPPAPARLPTATTTPVTVVPKRPSAVRLNFTSDPAGATVTRGDDGTVLGTTPLSLEVAYSDSAVPFVLSKNGYEVKRIYVVPNLPAPLFANLKALSPGPDPAAVKAARERSSGHSSRAARKATAKPAPAKARPSRNAPADEDAVLEPSYD